MKHGFSLNKAEHKAVKHRTPQRGNNLNETGIKIPTACIFVF